MGNYDHVFTRSNTVTSENGTDAAHSRVQAASKAWQEHVDFCSGQSLFEGLKDLNLTEVRSTNDFDAINVGPTPDVEEGEEPRAFIPENRFAAVNAVLSIASRKYQLIEPGKHIAWFNPLRNAEGVKSVLGDDGEWRFYDWSRTRGTFVASKMSYKRRKNQANKHTEIDAMFEAADVYGEQYQIVLIGKVRGEYERKIRDRLEMSLPEVWEEINKDYEQVRTRSHLHGNGAEKPEVELTPEATEFLDELGKLDVKVRVYYNTTYADNCNTIYNPEAKETFMRRARQSKGVVWTRIEPLKS